MSTTKRAAAENTYRVTAAMNDDDGTMAVHPVGRREEYEVVDYTDSLVRERLSALSPGETVRLELSPVAPDADEYAATRVMPGAPGIGAL